MNFLIIGNIKQNLYIEEVLIERGHTYYFVDTRDVFISNKNIFTLITKEGKEINFKDFDCVLSNNFQRTYINITYLILKEAQRNGLFVPQNPESIMLVNNKTLTSYIVSQNVDIKMPKQVFYKNGILSKMALTYVDSPLILKPNDGTGGKGLIYLDGDYQTETVLEDKMVSTDNNYEYLIQDYIYNNHEDERYIVLDDKIINAEKRKGTKDIRNGLSTGGNGEILEWDEQTEKLCVDIAKSLNLVYCGIDIIRDCNGEPYLLEVNARPGDKIVSVTGYNHFVDVIKYFEKNYKK